jgi:hypothetical protein
VYVESARSRQARRARRSAKLLEFVRSATEPRVVPHLVLDPPRPEEASWVGKYLTLADCALDNHDLPNPAERPEVKEPDGRGAAKVIPRINTRLVKRRA